MKTHMSLLVLISAMATGCAAFVPQAEPANVSRVRPARHESARALEAQKAEPLPADDPWGEPPAAPSAAQTWGSSVSMVDEDYGF